MRETIGFAVKRPMEQEVSAITGAAWGEKNDARSVQRNGYRERDWGEGIPITGPSVGKTVPRTVF